MNNIPEKYISKIQPTELLRPGVVKIPYALNEKKWDVIIYNEKNGFKIRINKYTNNIRKKIKDKETHLPKRKTNSIEKNKTVFIKELGIILDTYVGTNRPKILQKAEDAYTLLMEEERGMKINETAKKIYNIVGSNIPKEAKELLRKAKEFFGNKTLEESKIFVNKAKKNPRKKEVFKKMLIIAGIIGITGAGVMGLRKLGNYRTKQDTDKKTIKEIEISDKQKNNNIPSDTIHRNDHISQKNSKQNIKSEETKKEPIENIKTIPKEKKTDNK